MEEHPPFWAIASAQDAATESQIRATAATARLWAAMADALDEARRDPAAWVPMHPDRDPGFRERNLAVRAASADLAMRLHLPVGTVRTQADAADRGRRRVPQLWREFSEGLLSAAHLRAALDASAGLDEDTARAFDGEAVVLATRGLTPSSFGSRLRALAGRLDERALAERRLAAIEKRGVWIEHTGDGMAWLTAYLPSEAAVRAMAHLDGSAVELAAADGETRTRDQLRADVAADLLSARGTPSEVTTTVQVTVPVLSLLGAAEAPASLDGVAPIDAETARELCGDATSFFRILTDPVSSTVLDVDRRSYRPPADLRRFVQIRDRVCARPGCTRSARNADLDHVRPWSEGGVTSADNLAALCPACHKLKHETLWDVRGTAGRLTWTSPVGGVWRTEPPPELPVAVPATGAPEHPPF